MGGIYHEQKEAYPLPTISSPSLLTTKNVKPMSRKHKKLVVLHNFTSLSVCSSVTQQMKDASTDIIVVSNEPLCKEEIAKDFDKHFSRGCNIIEVTSLQPISITQRIVYALLEKNNFVARDADHIVFTLLSEYSRGAATIVHMLTSLMQKSEDNSRTGFELAKQQLKLHIAHQRGLLQRCEIGTKITFTENDTSSINGDFSSQIISSNTSDSSHSLPAYATKLDTEDTSDNSSTCSSLTTDFKSDTEVSDSSSSDSKTDSDYESMHGNNKNLTRPDTFEEKLSNNIAGDSASRSWFQKSDIVMDMSTGPKCIEEETVMVEGYVKQTDASDSDEEDLLDLPEGCKSIEDRSILFSLHNTLHLFINDLLTCDEYSILAHHLLNCLCVIGPIPIPLFLIEELDNIITEAVTGKNNGMQSSVTPLTQQLEAGVLRNYPHVFLYHEDFNPDFKVATSKLMYIPKLLCDAVISSMHSGDVALSIACVQQAVKNLLMELSLNQLHFMLVVLNQLDESCSKLHEKFNEENIKLKVQIAYSVGLHKEISSKNFKQRNFTSTHSS